MYINTLYSPDLFGGAERVLQTQAEAMVAAGHEVAVLAISSQSGLHLTHVNGIRVWRTGIHNLYSPADELRQRRHGRFSHALWHLVDSYNPLMAGVVRKVLREFQPDVASCHNLPGWSISAWDALEARGIPIVQVLHDQYLLCSNAAMYRDGRRCKQQCGSCSALRLPHRRKSVSIDTLVGVSNFISAKLLANGYCPSVRSVRTIPNIWGASTEDIPQSHRSGDGSTVFGFIGRLVELKGIELLLDAFRSFAKESWKLLIAGSGDAKYEAHLKEQFAHPQIKFLGQTSAREFFPQIDFTVVPSLWEDTLPSVIFESLVYGRPVLGSALGGIPEMLDSSNGMLFAPGNRDDLIRAMERMAADQAEFQDRFKAIQLGAEQYRNRQAWVQKWLDVYYDAIAARTAMHAG